MQLRLVLPLLIFGLVISSCKSVSPTSQSISKLSESQIVLKDLIRVELPQRTLSNGTLGLFYIDPRDPSSLDELEQNLRVEFEGVQIPLFRVGEDKNSRLGGLLPIPYGRTPGVAQVSVSWLGSQGESQKLLTSFEVIAGKYSSEVLKVQAHKVAPTRKKDLQRIEQELVEVGAIYKTITPQRLWRGAFQLPIESAVTSEFGTKRVYNGKLKNFHTGLDLRAAMNTSIYAPASGRVVLAKDLFFTGNTVMLDHGYGLITLYAHLNEIKVKKGDILEEKQLLGLSGKTGRVNGPHLHWQCVIHGVKVNPLGLTQSWMP